MAFLAMSKSNIQFHKADLTYRLLFKNDLQQWLTSVAKKEGFIINDLSIILCSDEFLYKLNVEYLQHNTYTDIITFDYSEGQQHLSGELYISIDRVKENAVALLISTQEELHRVMVHGLLHLCGYGDKKPAEKKKMSEREDLYLSLRKFL